MNTQTEKELATAYVEDTISLLQDVLDANKIPKHIALTALFGIIFKESEDRAQSSAMGFLIKLSDIIDIMEKSGTLYVMEAVEKKRLK